METQRDIQGADPGRVRLPLLRAIDPVGSKGRSRLAVGREMKGGSCISESSTEQSGEGGFLRGRPGAGETVRRLLWFPEQGTDARELGWVDTLGSALLLLLSCSPCPLYPGLCSWGEGIVTGLGASGTRPVSPSAPPFCLGQGCVPWSSWYECRAGSGKGFTQCGVLTLGLGLDQVALGLMLELLLTGLMSWFLVLFLPTSWVN